MFRSNTPYLQPHPHKSLRYPTTARRLPQQLKYRLRQGIPLGIELSPNGRVRVPIERFAPGRVEMFIAGDPDVSFNILQANEGFVLPGYKGLIALMGDTDQALDFMASKTEANVFALPLAVEGRDLRVSGKQMNNKDRSKVITKVQMDNQYGLWGLRRVESVPTNPDETSELSLNNRYITLFHRSDQAKHLIQTGLSAYYDEQGKHTAEWVMGVGAMNYGASESQAALIRPTNSFPINTIIKWNEDHSGTVQHTVKVKKESDPDQVGKKFLRHLRYHFSIAAASDPDRYAKLHRELKLIEAVSQSTNQDDSWIKDMTMARLVAFFLDLLGGEQNGASLELISQNGHKRIPIGGSHHSLPQDLSSYDRAIFKINSLKVSIDTRRGKFYIQEKLHDIDSPEALQDQEMHPLMWQTLDVGTKIYAAHHKPLAHLERFYNR